MCSCECAVACLCPRNFISNVVASTIHDDIIKRVIYIYVNKRCSTHMEPLWKVINIYTYAHKNKHIHIHMYIHIYVCIYTHIHKYTCMYMCVSVCVCVWEREGREGRGGGGWVGCVGGLVSMCWCVCVCCAC